ncbi:rhamnan synthesis F family protein [Lichenicoccus sp.]|uniref:rhamnan synthesis F family protein n=1 Tax=Lichenicoccus sp. TaxID=2781899 RepID=UPI003D0B5AFA
MGQAVCLFAMHSADGRLPACVLHYLRELGGCGLAVHVALSGMAALHPEDRAALDDAGAVGHFRANRGLDFAAWQHLVELGCVADADFVVLANDSVIGPLQPLAPIFARMQRLGCDVWGMVESHEMAWHLQSWFLCFTQRAWHTPQIARILALPFRDMDRAEIILHGEVGLGAAITAAGLSWAACWPDHRRGLRRLLAINPMHLDWMSILGSGAVPFIKVALLRENPMRVPWLHRWPELALRSSAVRSGQFPMAWICARIGPVSDGPRASLTMCLLYVLLTRDRMSALRAMGPGSRRAARARTA